MRPSPGGPFRAHACESYARICEQKPHLELMVDLLKEAIRARLIDMDTSEAEVDA